jgi:hypothetical protein
MDEVESVFGGGGGLSENRRRENGLRSLGGWMREGECRKRRVEIKVVS